jgi:2-C-methyl-D-erythritol 4-phosphate cytidylyltransferase/2-C-methyl-D-erythritol 2,4-cyclodiphosphate synthase
VFVSAIIAAGGAGSRLGAGRPKQFVDLGDGRSMLQRTVDAVSACAAVNEVIVALPPGAVTSLLPVRLQVRCVEGGARRQDSVANALARAAPHADVVVVHDAARPFVTAALIERTVLAAHHHGAAVAAMPAQDTVKQIGPGEGGARVIATTLPRDTIYLAQTPQAFRREVLARAIEAARATDTSTDEAALVEQAGFRVHIVDGEAANIKITTAADLAFARRYVSEDMAGAGISRIGTGYDLHRLVAGRPLVLAGVRVPFALGLAGHSDADVVCHAVTDAVLGAAGAGDIGRLFPDTDARWKDADSLTLLRQAMDVVRESGFQVGNVDVTVIAQQPRLLPFLDAMRANLAAALGCDPAAVSIKGKTNEGVDSMGRGESMACHAVALLSRT